ncbi:DUF4367 domain-containing protein [Oscillibacter sp.]|uniref:DUF4367 domain-containing protein n=1 Tax=Oscillibacter sp. TaxID=1945593 RepID=UPI0028AFB7E9|nr:DUF4367 domain-containing protein [Oscillibacter sp.]
MTRQEELRERYENALFALMMNEVAISEGRKALEENERLKNDPTAEVPEDVSRRCQRTIRQYFAKQSARKAGKFTVKVFGRIAMAAGIAAMLFTGAFAASETVRINTLNLVVEVFEESTDFYFTKSSTSVNDSQITAEWLPSGYVLKDQGKDELGRWCTFTKSENEYISVMYTSGNGSVLSADTENAETESVQINGIQATLIKKDCELQLAWGTEDQAAFIQIISTGITSEELIHMANKLKY